MATHWKLALKPVCKCGGRMKMFKCGWTCEFDKDKIKNYDLNWEIENVTKNTRG